MANTAEKSTAVTGREFRAEARFQRTSPQKAKLVLDTIKGQRVEQALNTLMFTRKRIAPVVEKALRSAVQNANYLSQEQGFDLDLDRLFVKMAVANEGPRSEAHSSCPDGPRVPLPASPRAYHRRCRGKGRKCYRQRGRSG